MHVAIVKKDGKTHFVTKNGQLSVDPKRAFLAVDRQVLVAHLDACLLNPKKFVLTYRPSNDEEAKTVVDQISAEYGQDREAVDSQVSELAAIVLENVGWPILAGCLRGTVSPAPAGQ